MYKVILTLMVIAFTYHCSVIQTEQILPVFNPNSTQSKIQRTPANMKVAFLGDSHDGKSFREVLKLIKSQKAELAVHMGDLSYSILPSGPRKWDAAITEVLGPDFPYLATIGNHDTMHWHEGRSGYITLFKNRIKKNKNLNCQVDSKDADFGVKSFANTKA